MSLSPNIGLAAGEISSALVSVGPGPSVLVYRGVVGLVGVVVVWVVEEEVVLDGQLVDLTVFSLNLILLNIIH